MPYVMVPVPEEHVEDVMQFILRATLRANQEDWDQDAVISVWDDADELTRTLISFIARATVNETEVFETDAATAVQLSGRETAAIIRELNETAREFNRPNFLTRHPTVEVLPNGRTLDKMALAMELDLANLVQGAERAELEANPLPGTAD
jgi:hypothetical protein